MFARHPKYVRVRDKSTKHEFSVPESTFDEEHMVLLPNKAAAACDGTPLEPKHYVAPESLSNSSNTPRGQLAEPSDKE